MTDRSDDAALASAYGQLLGLLVESPGIEAVLERVVHLAADAVSPATACGITIRQDGRVHTAASSSQLAAQVDEIQYGDNEGPCLDSMRTGLVVVADELGRDERWPKYGPHAEAFGVMSSLSIPLVVDGESLGALNLYSPKPGAFGEVERAQAEALASQCTAALTLAFRQVRQAQMHRQLAEALTSSSTIEQAVGILMSQQRCTADVAFDLLRQASQNRNRKLRDIAADIITSVSGQPPKPRPSFRANPADATRPS